MPDAELGKVVEEAEYLQKPQNDGNHDNAIQNALDLTLHGDEAVYQPKKQPDHAKCDDNGDKRHLMFSIHFFWDRFSLRASWRRSMDLCRIDSFLPGYCMCTNSSAPACKGKAIYAV
jgi:hypothetical protein